MEIKEITSKIGLNESQTRVYITLLQMGSGTIQEISLKSGIKRTTIYSILDNLIQRGLVLLIQKGAHREYIAENPNKIPQAIEQDIFRLKNKQEDIINFLPELLSFYNVSPTKPKIRTYEGIEGIKKVFEESLHLKRGEETLVFSAYESVNKYMKEYIQGYIKRRARSGITQRCIAEYSPESIALKKNDKNELRTTRLIEKGKFPITNQINIFGNKVFIASYRDLIGVILESEEIAKTQRSIFELAWLGAEKNQIE